MTPSEPLALGSTSYSYSGSGGYIIIIQVTATIVPTPVLDPSSITSVCTGSTALLNATTPQNVTGGNFFWYDAPVGGTLVFTGNPYSPVVTGNTSYYVAYGNGACENSRLQVDVTELPAPPPSATNGSACPGASATLTASAGGANDFNWYDDAIMTTLLGTGSSFSQRPPCREQLLIMCLLYMEVVKV